MNGLPSRAARLISAPALLLAFLSLPLEAQTRPSRAFTSGMRYGVGYTAAVPEALIGLGGIAFFGDSPIGAFADWKMTLPSLTGDDIYCPPVLAACTVDVAMGRNDQEIRTIDEWLVFNAGLMYAITPELAIMAGGGIVRQTRYREFFEEENNPDLKITPSGGYYVDDEDGTGWVGQFVGGMLFRAGPRLAFRIGYETAPGGMSVGGYIVP